MISPNVGGRWTTAEAGSFHRQCHSTMYRQGEYPTFNGSNDIVAIPILEGISESTKKGRCLPSSFIDFLFDILPSCHVHVDERYLIICAS